MASYISTETKKVFEEWNNETSESSREALLKNHLIHLYLNTERREFLKDFTNRFKGDQKISLLKLCRKILVQNPERVMDFDPEFYRMRRDEIQLEINNDIALESVEWIDEELCYLEAVKALTGTDSATAQPISASTSIVSAQSRIVEHVTSAKTSESPYMTKKEALAFFRWSPSTFDRRVKVGFPYNRAGGKIGLIDRALAVAWVEKHEPRKIAFVRKGAKEIAANLP